MDLAYEWDNLGELGELTADLVVRDNDLLTNDCLRSAILISLFTDRRASIDDVGDDEDLRGWWGDTFEAEDDALGSHLWLLLREKRTPITLTRARLYARQALQWLLDDGVARAVTVDAAFSDRGELVIEVTVITTAGEQLYLLQNVDERCVPDDPGLPGEVGCGDGFYPPPTFDYITTPPYPARGSDDLRGGVQVFDGQFTSWPAEFVEISGDISGGALVPITIDLTYRLEDGSAWEATTIAGDISGGALVPVVVDYTYRDDSGDPTMERIVIGGDISAGVLALVAVDYPNWPTEALQISGDITGGALVLA